jgi:hypothetical protein
MRKRDIARQFARESAIGCVTHFLLVMAGVFFLGGAAVYHGWKGKALFIWCGGVPGLKAAAKWVKTTPESNVAYSSPKTSTALSTPWKGRKRHNASIQLLCSQLERLTEGLGRGSGGFGVGRVDVRER